MPISLPKLYRYLGGMYYFRLQCRRASQASNNQAASKMIRAILPFLHRSNNIRLGPDLHQGIGPLYGCIAEFLLKLGNFDIYTYKHTHTQGGSYLSWPVHGSALHGDLCAAGCEAHMNFAYKSTCLLADNIRNAVDTIHRSQEVLKMLSLSITDLTQLRRQTVESNWKMNNNGCIALLQGMDYCCFTECKLQKLCWFSCTTFWLSIYWAGRFRDFVGVCFSKAPLSCNFSSLSTRRLCFCCLSIKSPAVLS
jgi:hypothetical protein